MTPAERREIAILATVCFAGWAWLFYLLLEALCD